MSKTGAEDLAALTATGLQMVEERLRDAPGFSVYISIRNQLRYISKLLEAGERPSEEERSSFTLGVLAAREFETSDPQLADVLFEVSYRVNRL